MAFAAILAAMIWIAVRRPAFAVLFFFVFFYFAWRLGSVVYIDMAGPLSSEQLERDIGPGIAAVPLAIAQGMVIAALLFSFRHRRLQQLHNPVYSPVASLKLFGRFDISDIAFGAVTLFTVALWVELLMRGPIPIFAGMERYDYSRLFGGPLNHLLTDWGSMLAIQIGIFFVAPTYYDRPFDRRFGVLLAILLLYLFLAGHRFSSFFSLSVFFIVPIGVAMLAREGRESSARRLFSGAVLRKVWGAGAALVVLIAIAVAYSYVFVRGFEGAKLATKLSQRILVQQGEMWWMTYERVFLQGNWNGGFAAYKLFVDPFSPGRNSTMQLLMEQGLPLERAHYILGLGSAYTGGWPEVFFELGGPIGGFVLVALSAILFSEIMFLLVRCLIEQRYVTCFFLIPVLYAVWLNIVTGMVNSFTQVTFVMKTVAALAALVAEERWRHNAISVPRTAASEPLPAPQEQA